MEVIRLKTLAMAVGFIDLGFGIFDISLLAFETAHGPQPPDVIQLILAFSFVVGRILAACVLLDATRTNILQKAIQRADIWRSVNAAYFVLVWGALVLTISSVDNDKPYFRWYLGVQWIVIVLIVILAVFIGLVSAFVGELVASEKKQKSVEDDAEG
ncbi:hypothetical protein Ocin01_07423 [Orchesella cincta]|uniref:Transmembrane protein n=1 Tax=Orchesella cincta TaxID=48709 RepID=A0A1D2N2X6_ORCCI|nr:hypothetical protein Ocin01_07423 [Orchesella cincta]